MATKITYLKEFRDEHLLTPSGIIVPYERWLERKCRALEKQVEELRSDHKYMDVIAERKQNIALRKKVEELRKLLMEVEGVDAHADVQNFSEDLQLRISDELLKQQKR